MGGGGVPSKIFFLKKCLLRFTTDPLGRRKQIFGNLFPFGNVLVKYNFFPKLRLTTCAKTGSPAERMNITFVPGRNMAVLSSLIQQKGAKCPTMSTKDTIGSTPQHSHPHNNTMSRNEKFWVDQVTVPPPPLGNDKGWATTRGGGGRRKIGQGGRSETFVPATSM